MINKQDIFYSKILLFGEYSIILGSMGLTIPFSHFNGQLAFINDNSYTDLNFAKKSNLELIEYCKFLESNSSRFTSIIDIPAFKNEIKKGLFFESSIPESYGLGSSGALVASIYSKYAFTPIKSTTSIISNHISILKSQFAELESYFHGTSSGIDPLICYLNTPLRIESLNTITPVDLPLKEIENGDAIFLLDTGKPGKTAPLVKQFMNKVNNETNFKSIIDNQLSTTNNNIIISLLKGHISSFIQHLQKLSLLQYQYFREIIPESIINNWKDGLKNELFTLKLCGSGGGGYVLGFTREYSKTRRYFKNQQKDIIPVYQAKKIS